MLIAAFRALTRQLLIIMAIIAICALIVRVVAGAEAALALLDLAILKMKGPWVWTFGFGLASFVMDSGRKLPATLDGILVTNETTAAALSRIERSTYHRNALRYTFPTTFLGAFLTAMYGIPQAGFSYVAIFAGVCAVYYIGAYLLFHFVEITLAFHCLFENMDSVEFKPRYSPLNLENLTTYLALSTTLGLVAIYAGFRGTLTAGFQFTHEVWRAFLTTPLILFLPGTLFYNYYPRYVLRKIVQHKVIRTMERLGAADEEGAKGLVYDLKECGALNAQILPFIDYKSVPSYVIAIAFAASVAYNNDPAVKTFVQYLLGKGSN
jgi:hypothetical protein